MSQSKKLIKRSVAKFDLKLIHRDGRDFIALNAVTTAACKAVADMGLSGEEAERMIELVEKIIVAGAASDGIGLIDTDNGRVWLPEEIIELDEPPTNKGRKYDGH